MSTSIKWRQDTIASLVDEETVQSILDSIDLAVEAITLVLDLLVDIAEVALLAAELVLDVTRAAIMVAIEVLQAFVDSMKATSLHVTYYIPDSWRTAPTSLKMLDMVASSLLDEADENRPIANSEYTTFASASIWVAAPNIRELVELWNLLAALFNLPDMDTLDGPVKEYPPRYGQGTGQLPDWVGYRLSELFPFNEFVDGMEQAIAYLMYADNKLDVWKRMLDVIRSRIQAIKAITERIIKTLAAMIKVITKTAGVNLLGITGEGNSLQQANIYRSAANHPDFPWKDSQGLETVAVLVFHANAGPGAVVNLIGEYDEGGGALRLVKAASESGKDAVEGAGEAVGGDLAAFKTLFGL